MTIKGRHHLRVKEWEKIFQMNGTKLQTNLAILITEKIYFKPNLIRGDREGHTILIKRKIHQDDIEVLNIYVSNTRALMLMKKKFNHSSNYILSLTQWCWVSSVPYFCQ